MRAPEALLLDIASASKRLASYVSGMTREQFLADDKTKAATVREIEIIGEACARLPSAYREAHPEIPWSDLARLRNIYIHVYERIRYDRVWITATRTIPPIAAAIAPLIPPEPDHSDPET
jgi:uncharacterized protein with HEPN domain